VVLGAVLVAVVRPPVRPTGPESVRGRRVFRGLRRADEVTVAWRGATVRATHARDGWRVDATDVSPQAADALDDLVATLAHLRAIDAFRPRDAAAFGLDDPRGSVTLRHGRRTQRLTIGGVNAAASAFYARLDGDTAVLQVGSGLSSLLERVLYTTGRQRPDSG
jgi:uncharacterized protein DUF4340